MQVSQVNDHVTHAVIGGKQSIEFGISNSAEFFNILSSTLYKDQILAVVREVLCNAWDAHIEAGCTDRPVLVTLDNDKFTIRDFGKGIHHDDIGPIYGTYGNSTKKNDGNQTGGFGLGCKAPFAYTDHFEVISCHAGTKTIYNMSKSSAQAMGKSGIIPIASFPTTETGLTVTIRIRSTDYRRFNGLIQRIAANGDMNIQLNGKQLDTIGFDLSKGNFMITKKELLDTSNQIMVRYGNVVYPVDTCAETADQHGAVLAHLKSLGSINAYSIVFQAPAHSIAVTPSRESLSMQEHTINTLKGLFAGFLESMETTFKEECVTYAQQVTAKAVAEQRVDELLKRAEALPVLAKEGIIPTISDFGVMAKVYLQHHYPPGLEYRKADVINRLQSMVKANLLDRGKVQSFLVALQEVTQVCDQGHYWSRKVHKNDWLQRKVLAPLMTKLSAAKMDTSKLFVCNREDTAWEGSYREGVPPLVSALKAKPHHLLATLPYLRNIVVITTRRQGLVDRAYKHDVFKKAGQYDGYLVYVAGRKKGDVEAARQFFAKQGMVIADLTLDSKEDTVDDMPIARTPRKPAKKGLVKLTSILCAGGQGINTEFARQEDAPRIEDPEFVIQLSFRQGTSNYSIGNFSAHASQTIIDLFGEKGGIAASLASLTSWQLKGAKGFNEYVTEKVCSYILNNPNIAAYWSKQSGHVTSAVSHKSALIDIIYSTEELANEFGLTNTLSKEEQQYLFLWGELRNQYKYRNDPQITAVDNWLKTIAVSPEVTELITKLNSSLTCVLDLSEVRHLIKYSNDPLHKSQVIKLLISIINQ